MTEFNVKDHYENYLFFFLNVPHQLFDDMMMSPPKEHTLTCFFSCMFCRLYTVGWSTLTHVFDVLVFYWNTSILCYVIFLT